MRFYSFRLLPGLQARVIQAQSRDLPVFFRHIQKQQEKGAQGKAGETDHLGDPDVCGTQIQAVGAQPFDDPPAKPVPHAIPGKDLPPEFAVLGIKVEHHKPQQIPQGFIQECGVYRRARCGGRIGDHHAPGQIGGPAKGLTIDKIAPPPDDLADEQPQGAHIQEGQGVKPLAVAPPKQQHDQDPHDHAAINGQSALPDLHDVAQVLAVIIPAVYHVIEPGPHHCAGQGDQQQIDHRIGVGLKLAGAAHHIHCRQQKSRRQKHTIPADGPAADMEGHLVQFKDMVEQTRKGNIMGHLHSPLIVISAAQPPLHKRARQQLS